MTDQIILGIGFAVATLLIAYEAVETWRWRGLQNRPPSRFRVVRFVRRAVGGVVSIVTLRRWRARRAVSEPALTPDPDGRLGDAPAGPIRLQPGRIVVSGARTPTPQPIRPVEPTPQPPPARPSRLRLARDTLGAALVMGGFVVVFENLMPAQPQGDVEGETSAPAVTLRVVIVTPLPARPSPVSIATAKPVVPTPALVSSTPSPTPFPVPTASATPGPQPVDPLTKAPTAPPRPTLAPTPKPTRPPTPTPAPAPEVVSFEASTLHAGQLEPVTFSFACQNCATYSINFGDGSDTSGDVVGGVGTTEHGFALPGTFSVVLTVFNGEGLGAEPVTVTVEVP